MDRWFKVGAIGAVAYFGVCFALYHRDLAVDADNQKAIGDSIQFFQAKIDFSEKQIANVQELVKNADKGFTVFKLPADRAKSLAMHARAREIIASERSDIGEYTILRDKVQAQLRATPNAQALTAKAVLFGICLACFYVATVIGFVVRARQIPPNQTG
jgi:hypothetical protein